MPQTKTKRFDPPPAQKAWDESLEEVEYPPELVARWEHIADMTEAQVAAGEIKPQTAAELAAEFGIKLG
jgi:hypothetical protein